jgi:hypothetical protein
VVETTSTSSDSAVVATTVDPATTLAPTTAATEVEPTIPAGVVDAAGEAQDLGPLSTDAPPCPADVENHGQYVSGVAQDTPPGPGHGVVVSAAAQSDCGKDTTATEGDEPAPVGMEAERGDTDPTRPGKGGSNGTDGNGQGQGQGQGQGNVAGKGKAGAGGGKPATPPRPRGANG